MGYKMVVLDLDGTVINSSGRISPRTRAAVRTAQEAGLLVLVATGRRLRSALPYVRELALEGPAVFCNGAATVDLATWRTLGCSPMGQAGSDAVAGLLGLGFSPLICRHDLKGPDMLVHAALQSPPAWLQDDASKGHLGYTDHPVAAGAEALKLMVALPQSAAQEAVAFGGLPVQTMVSAGEGDHALLEVWHRAVSKAAAIHQLAGLAGINRRDIVAFGDNVNDVELLSYAGLGVAMGNAVPEALAAARVVTASCDEDGVASVLESLVEPMRVAI